MPSNPSKAGRKPARSADQRAWNACVALASRAWEWLNDEQRLIWNTEAKTQRTSGHRLFVKINAPRLRDGKKLLTELPVRKPFSPGRTLRELVITNRGGRIRLKLRVTPAPGAQFTVWGSRPCNQGLSVCDKCPRFGPLPALVGEWCDITELYFRKHGAYIKASGMQMAGKRIIIRLREELDNVGKVFAEVRALVPPPERPSKGRKRS